MIDDIINRIANTILVRACVFGFVATSFLVDLVNTTL